MHRLLQRSTAPPQDSPGVAKEGRVLRRLPAPSPAAHPHHPTPHTSNQTARSPGAKQQKSEPEHVPLWPALLTCLSWVRVLGSCCGGGGGGAARPGRWGDGPAVGASLYAALELRIPAHGVAGVCGADCGSMAAHGGGCWAAVLGPEAGRARVRIPSPPTGRVRATDPTQRASKLPRQVHPL